MGRARPRRHGPTGDARRHAQAIQTRTAPTPPGRIAPGDDDSISSIGVVRRMISSTGGPRLGRGRRRRRRAAGRRRACRTSRAAYHAGAGGTGRCRPVDSTARSAGKNSSNRPKFFAPSMARLPAPPARSRAVRRAGRRGVPRRGVCGRPATPTASARRPRPARQRTSSWPENSAANWLSPACRSAVCSKRALRSPGVQFHQVGPVPRATASPGTAEQQSGPQLRIADVGIEKHRAEPAVTVNDPVDGVALRL